jgi:hypothetical protein
LERDVQGYNNASVELTKREMTMKDDDSTESNDHWCMIMEELLQKGIKNLLQI